MARYIDADKIDYTVTVVGEAENAGYRAVAFESDIDEMPTADVVEVKHGEWEPIVKQDSYLEPPYGDTCKCSVCGYVIDVSETVYNYCPNCGAKMDGRSDT